MKNTKIVALVAAVALLVLGTAFASFAASYNWYEQDGEWRCADKDGEDIYDDWAKSGDGWYYLGEDGFMTRDALIEVENGYKYVDATGRMVTNDWKKVVDDEGDEYWMYFQPNGKAMRNKVATIGEHKYAFDDYGYMLTGWIAKDEEGVPSEVDWIDPDAKYYFGGEDDGAMKTGWQSITVDTSDMDEDFDETEYWFYFKPSNGQKYAAKEEGKVEQSPSKINGKYYAFDFYGRMQAEWEYVYTDEASNSIAGYAWFQSVEIGAKFADGWFRVTPTEDVHEGVEDDTLNWFYAKKGHLAHSEIKTINGKKYGFNKWGEMVSGLQIVTGEDIKEFEAVGDDLGKIYGATLGTVYYFSGDEENDGSMKTGLQTASVDDDPYSFYFDTHGVGLTECKSNKYYYNGIKLMADEDTADYMVFEALDGKEGALDEKKPKAVDYKGAKFKDCIEDSPLPANKYAIISKTGVVGSSGTKKDGNGYKAELIGNKKDGFYWNISVAE